MLFFFNFWALLKMYHFCVCNIFVLPSGDLINFSVAVFIHKIHVSDEAFFFLTIRMPMVTKLFRVVTCGEDLSPINTHYISTVWSCWVT